MTNTFTRLVAAVGLAALFATTAFAQMAPTTAKKSTMAPMTSVKAHMRHMKSGKTVMVHSYTKAKPGMKMTHVKGYTTKTGKVIKGYTRKAPAKKMGAKKMGMKKMAPMMKKP